MGHKKAVAAIDDANLHINFAKEWNKEGNPQAAAAEAQIASAIALLAVANAVLELAQRTGTNDD